MPLHTRAHPAATPGLFFDGSALGASLQAVETTGISGKAGDFNGGVKATSTSNMGCLELEIDTAGKTAGSFETTKLAKELVVELRWLAVSLSLIQI